MRLGDCGLSVGDIPQTEGDRDKIRDPIIERQTFGIANAPAQTVIIFGDVTPAPSSAQHGVIDVADCRAATTGSQKTQADVARSPGQVNQMLVWLQGHPVDEGGFPEPVDAATHQIIHHIITIGNQNRRRRGQAPACPPG